MKEGDKLKKTHQTTIWLWDWAKKIIYGRSNINWLPYVDALSMGKWLVALLLSRYVKWLEEKKVNIKLQVSTTIRKHSSKYIPLTASGTV
jgi:hypothetical protein